MIALVLALGTLRVNVSDTIPGTAGRSAKDRARGDVKKTLLKTKRVQLTEEPAQAILGFDLSVDSSRSTYERESLKHLKEEPAGCLLDLLWDSAFERGKKHEKDTLCRYRYVSEFRLIDVETGEILGGFRAEGQGWGDTYSEARSMAYAAWKGDVEHGIREMFRHQGRVLRTRGLWWWKRVKINLGKDEGLEPGHIYSVWKSYQVDARRRVGLVQITDVHETYAWARVLRGTYSVSRGDLVYEDVSPRLWQGVLRVMPTSGYAYDEADSVIAPGRDIYLGLRPSTAYSLFAPEFGLEFTRHASAWGLESWLMGTGRLDIIPEYAGLTGDLGLAFAWHHQPIAQKVILPGDPEGAEAFGLGLRASVGAQVFFGEDFSVFGTLGWRFGLQTPWMYYLSNGESDTLSSENGDGWRVVDPVYLEDGDLRLLGPVLCLGFAFRL